MSDQPLKVVNDDKPWYKEGLRFECTGCGQCCTGEPGAVWISKEEVLLMAKHFGLSVMQFESRYVDNIKGRYALRERQNPTNPKNYDCVFLKDNKCSVYELRPKQCRTFPWWKDNLKDEVAWNATAKRCEGINKNARLFSLEEIQKSL